MSALADLLDRRDDAFANVLGGNRGSGRDPLAARDADNARRLASLTDLSNLDAVLWHLHALGENADQLTYTALREAAADGIEALARERWPEHGQELLDLLGQERPALPMLVSADMKLSLRGGVEGEWAYWRVWAAKGRAGAEEFIDRHVTNRVTEHIGQALANDTRTTLRLMLARTTAGDPWRELACPWHRAPARRLRGMDFADWQQTLRLAFITARSEQPVTWCTDADFLQGAVRRHVEATARHF